jgi:probable F420-dependent oxidoreductase
MRMSQLTSELEARSIDAVFLGEHTHIPVHFDSPIPGGGDLKDRYRRLLDPFVTLASVATSTNLLLGTSICQVAQHDPISLAKTVATLDHLASGRFIFGVGHGWNREEARNHGVDPSQRRALLREHILAMKEIWHNDVARFDGSLVHFDDLWSWPKPVSQPHPPILVGAGAGPHTFHDIVEWADGWMPVYTRGFADDVATLRNFAESSGRDPQSLLTGVTTDPVNARRLERLVNLGVDFVVNRLPDDPDSVVSVLDDLSLARAQVVG